MTAPSSAARRGVDALLLLTMLALALGLANRLVAGWQAPLWFDESFSAEIASQTGLAGLLEWCLHELSGPVYYSILFLWEKIAGNGNIALRIPSFLFSVATPLLILWRGHPDRDVRLVWASIMALWAVGFNLATEARPYSLMVLLGCAQGIAFMRMMHGPTVRSAMLWTSVSALAVLTHYHAAVISGVEGIVFLAAHRRAALRCWPAVAPLIPMGGWMAFHLPFVLTFAAPGTAWYQRLSIADLWMIPRMLAGAEIPGLLLLLLMVATSIMQIGRSRDRTEAVLPEAAFIGSAVVSTALVIGMGFLQPTFTPRYLLPYVPGLLFAVALWTRSMKPVFPITPVLLIAANLGWAVQPLAARLIHPRDDHRYSFNFEQPSRWIEEHDVRTLIFLWDSPSMSISDPRHIEAVASFFLRRDGRSVNIQVLGWPAQGVDPNRQLLDAANRHPHSAMIWAYDVNVPGTRGIGFPSGSPRSTHAGNAETLAGAG